MRATKVYLAGPDVFSQDAMQIAKKKLDLCKIYGFIGLHPIDNELKAEKVSAEAAGKQIFCNNICLMNEADLCIANISPFRGPNVDDGTAFEIGYMCARGKLVVAYDMTGLKYKRKVKDYWQKRSLSGMLRLWKDKALVENFNLESNIMISYGIKSSGGFIISRHANDAFGIDLFEDCLKHLCKRNDQLTKIVA